MAREQKKRPPKMRMDVEELSIFCEQLALIQRSGLPLQEGMDALSENYRQTRMAELFETLRQSVLATGSLYRSITDAGVFPLYMREMVLIGERSGEMDTVLEGLAQFYHREAKIRSAVQNAITYPLILITIMAALITVLISQVLPIFEDVFRSMGIDTSTDPWIGAGLAAGRVVLFVAGGLIVLTLLSLLAVRLDHSGRVRARLFRLIAPLKRIDEKMNASRFASVMSMMLKSGLPLDESLRLIANVVDSDCVGDKVEQCRIQMEQGLSFPDAVDQLGIFEPLHSRMIRLGFQAGQSEAVLARVAVLYEDDVDDSIVRAISIIEPTLVALMSVIIGAILLSVMLPLLSLMGGMA
jgi:type IV pilus assembly protein PilC